ncbi:probable F-box protein At5g47300 [Daucus carota subsp. sativus]|uniref:probable F-box protein At5g47300 n=1 Tax=Daucus carota subsp. sativus TaxID=79200 RepID=UPI0007F00734|nr:PREDICTED: probable F-box protein At5g47300 [Daucus carota subsp. sativus]
MGEQKNATLPEDLMYAEILPRIPAKYIIRCRLVCKSWNSVFSRPAFVNSHLTHQLHNNSEENDRIIVRPCGFYEGVVDILSTDSIRVRKVPYACDTLCGSINGLVLMVSKPGKRFCLWNPAIGQVKLFDFPPLDGHYAGGFCWDHVQNDYKALLFCYDSMSSPARQICIYSTNSATWTSLCIPQNLMLPGLHDSFWMLLGHSTIVKGTPYWSCSKSLTLPGEKHERKFFWTFKFVPEINEFRILPDLDSLKCCGDTFSIVNIKDRLVGMTYNSVTHGGTNMVDMYSLDNEESSSGVWSKMYSIGPVYFCSNQRLLHAFRNGGEVLIRGNSGPFTFYDPKIKETKRIAGTTSSRTRTPTFFRELYGQCYSYTPSLVRVRGMESMQNFSTNGELKSQASPV